MAKHTVLGHSTKTSIVTGTILLTLGFAPTFTEAKRIHLTPEEKSQLATAHTVFITVLALTEKGPTDNIPFLKTLTSRFEDLKYTVVRDSTQPYDVEFKVKCEERKTWTGISSTGGDVDLADAPDRLWKGPACLLSYRLGRRDLEWNKEIRTSFPDAFQAAKKAAVADSGHYAMTHLNQRLTEYDFPVLLAAEWGQVDRLLQLLDQPTTSKLRKVKVLSVLSELHAQEAFPKLTELLESTDLQQETINALAGAGLDSIPFLIDLFRTSQLSPIRAEAAKALGILAAKTGDPRTIPPLVEYVANFLPQLQTSEDIDFPLLTEVVWAIGKQRWEPSLVPIGQLQEKVWLIFDNSKEMTDLREATSWTYKQLDLDGHVS